MTQTPTHSQPPLPVLLLPQYADSLMPIHIQQFQDSMKRVRSIMDVFAKWVNRVYKALRTIVDPIAKILLEIFVPLIKRTRLSKQSRHYLIVKHRVVERKRRYQW
jgi:hypothetical protein